MLKLQMPDIILDICIFYAYITQNGKSSSTFFLHRKSTLFFAAQSGDREHIFL